jgi:Ca-activated chloride channel family protein
MLGGRRGTDRAALRMAISMSRLLGLAMLVLLPLHADGQEIQPSFSASTDLVVLHVTVKDRNGTHVTGLPQDAFTVSEGGRPQTIRFYTSDDAPVTVGLMIDNSGSMRPNRDRLIAAGTTFAESSNPLDEMFAITFDDDVRAAMPPSMPFTKDVRNLRDALTTALNAGGRTALFDGLAAGLDYVGRGAHERKVLVLVSDGTDTASTSNFNDILGRVQASNVVIYTVAVVDPLERSNTKVLKQLAQASGGEAFQPENAAEIVSVLRHIARDIRHTYTIGYEPGDAKRDGTFRKVSVVVRSSDGRRLNVQTRTGYVAGRSAEAQWR